METALWTAQLLLAAIFLATGIDEADAAARPAGGGTDGLGR